MWRFGLFLAGMSALLLPSWVALPFGVSTAAAGLYLAWVRRGGRGEARKEEGDTFHDIGECARAKYYFENPQEADAIVAKVDASKLWEDEKIQKILEKYWRQCVRDLFINDASNRGDPSLANPILFAEHHALADQFPKFFQGNKAFWKDLKQAKKGIYLYLRVKRISVNSIKYL